MIIVIIDDDEDYENLFRYLFRNYVDNHHNHL